MSNCKYLLNPSLHILDSRDGIYFMRTSGDSVIALNETSYSLLRNIENISIEDIAAEIFSGIETGSEITAAQVMSDCENCLNNLIQSGLIIIHYERKEV